MKLLQFYKLSFLFLVGFLLQSCLKTTTTVQLEEINNSDDYVTHSFSCQPDNSFNVYDSTGYLHNYLIEQIENNCSSSDTDERVMEVADSILLGYFGTNVSSMLSSNVDYFEFASQIVDEIDNDKLVDWVDSLDITAQQKINLKDLNSILFNYDATNLCDIINDIKQYEADLLSSSTSSELQFELITASIARYSLFYWDDRFQTQSSFGLEASTRGFWKKFFVGVVDAAGAYGGGAMAGLPTVVGAIAGGIVGGTVSSVAAGRLWDIFAE